MAAKNADWTVKKSFCAENLGPKSQGQCNGSGVLK